MSSDQLPLPLGLSAKFDRELKVVLTEDPTQPAKAVFFEVWRRLKPEYEAMHQALKHDLSRQLEESSIRATLQSRVKNDVSISKSIDRREEFQRKEYNSPKLILDSMHDLVGFRIVVDYPSGLDKSYHLIEERFFVKGTNIFSRDRQVGKSWAPMFGAYHGQNFQVQMRPAHYNKGLSIYYGVLFEIQVTSIAESLYNRLAHPLHYKKSSSTLSRQDEMVIDISHGLSLCYWITIACMEERLEGNPDETCAGNPIPDTVRMVAGNDPEAIQSYLDDLVNITPKMPVIPGDQPLRGSKAGSSSLKRTASSQDTVSIELLLRSIITPPRENRSDAEIWDAIRDRLGLDDETYNRFLKSLTYDRMNDRKNSIQQRHHNTFEWVFKNVEHEIQYASDEDRSSDDIGSATTATIENSDSGATDDLPEKCIHRTSEVLHSLSNWLQADHDRLYWVSGKPGSGKSFFMKFIEKDQRTQTLLQRWQPKCRIVSHYLWKPGNYDQSSFKGMVCSLLHQILQDEKAIALHFLRESPKFNYKNDATDWETGDVKEMLFKVLDRSPYSYLVLIDGLDEVSKPHDGLSEVFRFLFGLAKMDRVKVCVSSRPETPFTSNFKSQPSLRMHDLTRGDIAKYTIDKLGELDLVPDDYLLKNATNLISSKANGVFIWVYIVLKRIKDGVDEFGETWDAILDHIDKAPSDLMSLYRDMLSRFGEKNDKYVQKAARYFQYTRETPSRMGSNIATLSLAGNENLLDAFSRPEDLPCVTSWVNLCVETEKTLFPISSGLLEIRNNEESTYVQQWRYTDIRIRPWIVKSVQFIHKTAIDFLDAHEGKETFGGYALGPESMAMIFCKVQIAVYSIAPDMTRRLDYLFLDIMASGENSSRKLLLSCNSHEALYLVHACSLNKLRGLLHPPCSVSYKNFSLIQLSRLGFYGYVKDFLYSSGTYRLEASAYVLLGACMFPSSWSTERCRVERYRLIKDILEYYSLERRNGKQVFSIYRGSTSVIMLAWRCYLLHELSLWLARAHIIADFELSKNKQLFEEVLVLFINLGLLFEDTGPKYLIVLSGWRTIDFVRSPHFDIKNEDVQQREPILECPAIYAEVNDAWLLGQLADMLKVTQTVKKMVKGNAFMCTILGDDGLDNQKRESNFFLISSGEDKNRPSNISLRELAGILESSDEYADHFDTTPLGTFAHIIPVLDKIGYSLPDVNKTHVCLHGWI